MRLLLSNCDNSRPIDRHFPHRRRMELERPSDGSSDQWNGNRVYLIVEYLAKKFDLLFSSKVGQSRGYLKKGKMNE